MATAELQLDLLHLTDQLRLKKERSETYVWDPCRRKWLKPSREEMVRQLWIQYFIQEQGISKNRIISEKLITVNELKRRFDILVVGPDLSPRLLVECKAPEISITQDVFDQIAVYNLALQAPYLLVSNGRKSFLARVDFTTKSFAFQSHFPSGLE